MNFRLNQRVAYVGPDANEVGKAWRQIVPQIGTVYTIREFVERAGASAMLLHEIHNTPRQWADGVYELAMDGKFFRPVVETDISVFTKMLTDTRLTERV